MILVISSKYDVSTNKVLEWLNSSETLFKRLNVEDFSLLNYFNISNEQEEVKFEGINFRDISAIWHRRGRLKHLPEEVKKDRNIYRYLLKEEDALIKAIEILTKKNIPYIGSYIDETENLKLVHLLTAKMCGLHIPNSIVTCSKSEAVQFFEQNKPCITKDLRYPIFIQYENESLSSGGTIVIKDDLINEMPEKFSPVFLQEYIEKEIEIRIFFFQTQLFSMAIFSQRDEKTKTDYRNYNKARPNRFVPFLLPEEIKIKILDFIKETELTTGSIDLILSKGGKYYFLEVNPMGQFDWLSKNCNYQVEKFIAGSLNQCYNKK